MGLSESSLTQITKPFREEMVIFTYVSLRMFLIGSKKGSLGRMFLYVCVLLDKRKRLCVWVSFLVLGLDQTS